MVHPCIATTTTLLVVAIHRRVRNTMIVWCTAAASTTTTAVANNHVIGERMLLPWTGLARRRRLLLVSTLALVLGTFGELLEDESPLQEAYLEETRFDIVMGVCYHSIMKGDQLLEQENRRCCWASADVVFLLARTLPRDGSGISPENHSVLVP